VADAIVQVVGRDKIAFLHHDAYYRDLSHLTIEERAKTNFDHPNSLETELLIEHLTLLKSHKTAQVPIYDFKTHSRTKETITEEPRKVIVVEGILIFAEPELLKLLDVKIFVDTDDDIRFIRRMERDVRERGRTVESVVKQYYDTVRPMHLEFVEPSKRNADVIVPEGGYNRIAIEMITSHIAKCLAHPHHN
jgi:uridine kinase